MTAFRPWALSFLFVSLAALALPPFRPSATAAGFFFMVELYYVAARINLASPCTWRYV